MGFFKNAMNSLGLGKSTGQMGDIQGAYQLNPQEQAYQQYLAQQLTGQGESVAQKQLQIAQQEAFNQAQAMAASNRAINPAIAQRQAQMANAQLQAQTNQQAALLRAQEQAQASGQMGDFLSQLRQARMGIASQQAAASERTKARRLDLALKAIGGASQAAATGATSGGGAGAAGAGGAGAAGSAGLVMPETSAAMLAASDENAKENIELGDKEIKSFLDAIKAYKYEYKDKEDGEGEFVSPMAQDLEKSKVGKKMVQEDGTGKKMINYDGHSLGSMLAAQGYMHKKIENIESKLENILKTKSKKG